MNEAARAVITLADPAAAVIDPGIYGQYFEHVEDCVDPGLIDDGGLREDVITAAADLGVPVVRWPGGCFADTYHWQDGIGPAADRPVRRNWHWGGGHLERNRFGTDEFLDWCRRAGAEPYVNVNLGTGDLIEALRWLNYCNGAEPTTDVLARRANGREEPWNVRYWGIGNETWGSWEAGCSTVPEYAAKLANWAEFFKRYDPDLKIIAVGSHAGEDPAWDSTVLDRAGSWIDLLSIHLYGAAVIGREATERDSVIFAPAFLEKRIGDLAGLLRADGGRVGIAMDEWNIRHYRETEDGFRLDRSSPRNGADALFAAGVFHAMIRNADLVTMANYVFLVNGNGVINARDGRVELTALYQVFRAYRTLIQGTPLSIMVDGPRRGTPPLVSGAPDRPVDPAELPADLPVVDAVATSHDGVRRLAVINRSDQPVEVMIDGDSGRWRRRTTFAIDLTDERLLAAEPGGPWDGTLGGYSITLLTEG